MMGGRIDRANVRAHAQSLDLGALAFVSEWRIHLL